MNSFDKYEMMKFPKLTNLSLGRLKANRVCLETVLLSQILKFESKGNFDLKASSKQNGNFSPSSQSSNNYKLS